MPDILTGSICKDIFNSKMGVNTPAAPLSLTSIWIFNILKECCLLNIRWNLHTSEHKTDFGVMWKKKSGG